MTGVELLEWLQGLPDDALKCQVVVADGQDRAHVVMQALITSTPNWMSPTERHPEGRLTRVLYLNPPMADIDRCERPHPGRVA